MDKVGTEIQGLIEKIGGASVTDAEDLPQSGAYALILEIRDRLRIETGIHGKVELEAGHYLYAGRASRGLSKRIARHCRKRKTIRWHIDRLTAARAARVVDILVFPGKPEMECEIIRTCLNHGPFRTPVARFGSSDCTEKCPAHLLLLEDRAT